MNDNIYENQQQTSAQDTQPAENTGYVPYAPTAQQPVSPSEVPQPPKPEKRGSSKKWGARIVALILVAILALGGGYAGASLANAGLDRVVIQKVEGSSSQTSDSSGSTAQTLSSQQVAEKAVHSVVAIRTEQMSTNSFWFGSQVVSGAGSGVIISEDGYILTNYHVVSGADTLTVELQDGTTYDATVVGTYSNSDLAVIKIDATGLTPVTFADSSAVKQGETVYAIGNPEGNFSGSITQGIISALDRSITVSLDNDDTSSSNNPFMQSSTKSVSLSVFQFDAAVSPGNSGGGLFNANGELIGIVCAKSSDTDAEGLNFAILGNKAYDVATSIIATGTYEGSDDEGSAGNVTPATTKAVLGITASYLSESAASQYGYKNAGVYVIDISAKSTKEAGLTVGDRIVSIDDVAVSQVSDVTDYLADKNPGDTVSLTVDRSGKMQNITVTLIENTANS